MFTWNAKNDWDMFTYTEYHKCYYNASHQSTQALSLSHIHAHSCIQQEEYCLYVLKRSWTRTKLQTKMEFITNSWYGEQFMWIQKRNIETETYGTRFQFNVNNECFDKYTDSLDFTRRRSNIASAFRFFFQYDVNMPKCWIIPEACVNPVSNE